MLRVLVILLCVCFDLAQAQNISDKSYSEFEQDIVATNGILVVNYWATWCKPCIEELPHFEKLNSEMKSDRFQVYLVNLDFNSKFKESAIEFIKRKNIQSTVFHINDTDPNNWIDKADNSWSGAIPATMIYRDGKKVFFKEGEMTYDELKSIVTNNIK